MVVSCNVSKISKIFYTGLETYRFGKTKAICHKAANSILRVDQNSYKASNVIVRTKMTEYH